MQSCEHGRQDYDDQVFPGCPFCRTDFHVASRSGCTFKDQSRLTRFICVLLIVQSVMAVLGLGSSLWERKMLDAIVAGNFDNEATLHAALAFNDRREMIIGIAGLALFILCGLLVIDWLKSANRNARALGADLTISPGWSAGWFFIPVANLWKPYQAFKQIWQGSHQPEGWRSFPPTALLPLWWFCWLVGNGLGRVIIKLDPKTLSELYLLNTLNLVSCGFDVVVCLLFLELVKQVHRAQLAGWATRENLNFRFSEL